MKKIKLILIGILFTCFPQNDIHSQSSKADLSLVPGTVVKHVPASSRVFVGAPSIVIMTKGDYVISLNFTSIQKDDHGKVHN